MSFEQIVEFISGPNSYGYFFIIMILCGLGVPFKSDLVLIFMGTFSRLSNLSPTLLIVLAVVGLNIGDSLTFLFGRKGGFKILRLWPFSWIIDSKKVHRAGKFIKKKGPIIILLVRFLPGTRTVTFFTSGVFKLPFQHFLTMNVLGVSIFASLLILSGNLLFSSIEEAKAGIPYLIGGVLALATLFYFSSKYLIERFLSSERHA